MGSGKGYPKGLLRVPTVSHDAWASQPEAARFLGISVVRIGVLISVDHLSPAHNPDGEAGVTKESLKRESSWRESATVYKKMRRLIRDSVNFT